MKKNNKKRLLQLWENSLPKITSPFSGYPLSYFYSNNIAGEGGIFCVDGKGSVRKDYSHITVNQMEKFDREILSDIVSDSIDGKYVEISISDGMMPIFFKTDPPLIINPFSIKTEVETIPAIEKKKIRRFLGIKVGSKIIYERPKIDNDNYDYSYSKLIDDKPHYVIMCRYIVYIIRQGKIMSEISKEEYDQCVKEYRETAIRVDDDKLTQRLKGEE